MGYPARGDLRQSSFTSRSVSLRVTPGRKGRPQRCWEPVLSCRRCMCKRPFDAYGVGAGQRIGNIPRMATKAGTAPGSGAISGQSNVDARIQLRPDEAVASPTGKLCANVDAELVEHLRELAYVHRVSESSIVDVALRRFFAVGDDRALGVILHNCGATLRRKQRTRRGS